MNIKPQTKNQKATAPTFTVALQSAWQPHAALRQFAQIIGQALEPALEGFRKFQIQLQTEVLTQFKAPEVDWNTSISKIREGMRGLPDRTRSVACKAAECGWYVGPGVPFPLLWEIEKASDESDIHQVFLDYYRNDFQDLRCRILGRFSSRSTILDEAFQAHLAGKYTLSILSFLLNPRGPGGIALDRKLGFLPARQGKSC